MFVATVSQTGLLPAIINALVGQPVSMRAGLRIRRLKMEGHSDVDVGVGARSATHFFPPHECEEKLDVVGQF